MYTAIKMMFHAGLFSSPPPPPPPPPPPHTLTHTFEAGCNLQPLVALAPSLRVSHRPDKPAPRGRLGVSLLPTQPRGYHMEETETGITAEPVIKASQVGIRDSEGLPDGPPLCNQPGTMEDPQHLAQVTRP